MKGRAAVRRVTSLLLALVGASGLLVGLELFGAREFAKRGDDVAAVAIPAAIALYGLAAIVAGVGLLVRRRWAFWLGLATVAVGLVELAWQTTLLGLDPVTLFGVALWSLLLVLLLSLHERGSRGGRLGRGDGS